MELSEEEKLKAFQYGLKLLRSCIENFTDTKDINAEASCVALEHEYTILKIRYDESVKKLKEKK